MFERTSFRHVLVHLADERLAVVDKVGGDAAHDGGAAQAVCAVGEGAGGAVEGAARHAVLAVPGVGSAAGISQGIAVGIAGDGGRTCAAVEGHRGDG